MDKLDLFHINVTINTKCIFSGPVSCADCDKSFLSKYELSQHQTGVHGDHYTCDKCARVFTSQSGLYKHQRDIHLHQYKYHCPNAECGRGFVGKEQYTNHMNKHLDLKPYQCEKCRKGFTTKSVLTAHSLCCGKETRDEFVCETCNTAFKRKGNLDEHVKYAHSLGLCACVCGKRYKWPKTLAAHKKKCPAWLPTE